LHRFPLICTLPGPHNLRLGPASGRSPESQGGAWLKAYLSKLIQFLLTQTPFFGNEKPWSVNILTDEAGLDHPAGLTNASLPPLIKKFAGPNQARVGAAITPHLGAPALSCLIKGVLTSPFSRLAAPLPAWSGIIIAHYPLTIRQVEKIGAEWVLEKGPGGVSPSTV
jgi:hypothetical protein